MPEHPTLFAKESEIFVGDTSSCCPRGSSFRHHQAHLSSPANLTCHSLRKAVPRLSTNSERGPFSHSCSEPLFFSSRHSSSFIMVQRLSLLIIFLAH